MNKISFPGLGLNNITIKREMLTIFGFPIYWYAAIITAGIIAAFLYALKNRERFDLTEDNIFDVLIFGLPAAIIGARLYYVLFDLGSFRSFWDIFNLRTGGLAIYGGVIAAGITAVIFCKVKKINLGKLLDVAAIAFLLGQALGRWGNFFNAEVFGIPTSLPWRMNISGDVNAIGVHPLFLYESIWNIIGFILLHNYSKKSKNRFNGEIALWYVVWYGIGRGLMEGLRNTDFVLTLGGLYISQVLAFLSAIAAGVIIYILKKKYAEKKNEPEEYKKIYNINEEEKPVSEDIKEELPNVNTEAEISIDNEIDKIIKEKNGENNDADDN